MRDTSLYSDINYGDEKQVLILLRFYEELKSKNYGDSYNETLGCVLLDIDNAMTNVEITDHQRAVLKLTLEGMAEKDVADYFNISRQMVAKYMRAVAVKYSRYLVSKKVAENKMS